MAPNEQDRTVNPAGSPRVEGLGQSPTDSQRFQEMAKKIVPTPKPDARPKKNEPQS